MEQSKLCVSAEAKQPDFQNLLDTLRKEIFITHELTDRVSHSSNLLKQIDRIPVDKKETETKEPRSVIDFLWEQVWSLRRSNEEMQVVANHLQLIIGS